MENIILNVNGMECKGCENRIQNAIKNMTNVKDVIANHETGTVEIIPGGEIDVLKISEKINDLGFEVKE